MNVPSTAAVGTVTDVIAPIEPESAALIGARTQERLELIHTVVFYAPESRAEFGALGLPAGATSYVAQRSAALGAAGPGLVDATFLGFHPALIAAVVPDVWNQSAPTEVSAARARAADAVLHRLLGAEADSAAVTEAAALARRAALGAPLECRPMFAAHADAPWPDDTASAVLALWHAATLLREYRCDAHMVALNYAGLSGLEAVITSTATGRGFLPGPARTSRGWSEQEWNRTRTGLIRRGLITDDGSLTDAGAALRADVEENTTRLAAAPWDVLGSADTARLHDLVDPLATLLVSTGGFPGNTFAPGSPKSGEDPQGKTGGEASRR